MKKVDDQITTYIAEMRYKGLWKNILNNVYDRQKNYVLDRIPGQFRGQVRDQVRQIYPIQNNS